MGFNSDSPISAEIAAIHFALDQCISKNWFPNKIYCDCPGIARLLKHFDNCVAWRFEQDIDNLKSKLLNSSYPNIKTISLVDNQIVEALAHFGSLNPQLSLFFQGLDHPKWLDDLCRSFDFFV